MQVTYFVGILPKAVVLDAGAAMRRSLFALSLVAGVLATPVFAVAQSDATMPSPRADPATNPIPDPQSPAVASPSRPLTATPAEPTTTAPDVTVTARPLRGCKAGDQACIDQVSALIWTRYPKQIEAMCVADGWQRISQGFAMQQLGIGTNTVADHPSPATQALCGYGAKLKAR